MGWQTLKNIFESLVLMEFLLWPFEASTIQVRLPTNAFRNALRMYICVACRRYLTMHLSTIPRERSIYWDHMGSIWLLHRQGIVLVVEKTVNDPNALCESLFLLLLAESVNMMICLSTNVVFRSLNWNWC